MADSNLRRMSQEVPKPHDLSALRIHRDPVEKRGVPKGLLLLGAVLVVAVGAGAFFLSGRTLRPRKVEVVTASVVTEGQATTVLTATGYVEAEVKADLSPKITSRIIELNVTEGTRVKKGDVIAVRDRAGVEFAGGLSNYSSAEVNKIKGLRTDAIAVALGIHPYDEVIHRDNIVVTSGG